MLTALLLASALCAPPTEIVVTLKDGKSLAGTTDLDALQLEAKWGTATVQFAKIRSITFGTPAVIETQDGATLTGTLRLESFGVTADGRINRLAVANVASLSVVSRAPLTPETTTEGTAANGMTYCVRVPKGYQAGKPAPVILIFHGSNMNTNAYVNTIASTWPKLADEYVLLGINGENRNTRFPADDPRYNYTYINWVGPRSTMRGSRQNESPKLVMEVLKELKAFLPMSRIFVGGHSQGGYLTYMMVMHFPEAFAGAFPMAGGMIFQAEPTAFEEAAVRAAQRDTPIAILHGRRDGAVEFSDSEYAFGALVDDGFERIRLFATDGGHSFMHLPVEPAIRWLELMSSQDPEAMLAYGLQAAGTQRWRDAVAIANRVRGFSESAIRPKLDTLLQQIGAACKPQAAGFEKAIGHAGTNAWVDAFLQFREQFAFADDAKRCMAAYAALREKHAEPAGKAYRAARGFFNQRKSDEAYAKCQEIVDRYYASRWYPLMKRWLANRKKE